jgi:hypothetical protein
MSGAWSTKKRDAVETAFYQFLNCSYINSKDAGRICLGKSLYEGQRRTITEIFDALENDLHDIYILKSRQLGISTLVRALSIFMIGIHPGLKGAIIFDSAENKNEARAEVEVMIEDLPKTLKFPGIKGNNRSGLTLDNDAKVLFMSAGVKKTKTSGTLGRSVGIAFSHASEICSWDNDEGLESYRNSLSDINPDRLYIWESTARGFNAWETIWQEARNDPYHCKCIFLGWWSKETQMIPRDHRDFKLYGEAPPSEEEARKIAQVKELYGHQITPEQLAWARRKYDPTALPEGDAEVKFEGNPNRVQEQPYTESEAFQQTGSVFFAPEKLTDQFNANVTDKFQTYMYIVLDEFVYTQVLKAPNAKMVELKVWDAPAANDGVYVIGCDPAFGTSESNARSCIQVCRCYADGIDQVAEYAWPLITAQHLAWVLASLLGWYGSNNSTVQYALELNGPGMAVFTALKSLKFQLENGQQSKEVKEKGLQDVFRNVRTYVYNRADSMGSGANYHIKTTRQTKSSMLEQLRNAVSAGKLRIKSAELLKEMTRVTRDKDDGDIIGVPSGSKDDRVMAMAFAVHCWEEKVRRTLINTNRTRDAEAARQRLTLTDQVYLFQQNQLGQFFKAKRMERLVTARAQNYRGWRYR